MRDRLNGITEQIIGAAVNVHRELGPGILESAYEACLLFELVQRGLEVKSVERVEPVHAAHVLSYLRLSGRKVGLLINVNVKWLVSDGVKRIVNGFPE